MSGCFFETRCRCRRNNRNATKRKRKATLTNVDSPTHWATSSSVFSVYSAAVAYASRLDLLSFLKYAITTFLKILRCDFWRYNKDIYVKAAINVSKAALIVSLLTFTAYNCQQQFEIDVCRCWSREVHGPKIFGPARNPATTAQSNKVVYEVWLVCISCLLAGTEKW